MVGRMSNLQDAEKKVKKILEKWPNGATCQQILSPAEGGNAVVFFFSDGTNEFAFKYLNNRNIEAKERFKNEIDVVERNFSIVSGILPIIQSSKDDFWYTMPIAQKIEEYLVGKPFEEVVKGIAQLAETLEKLHELEISHRDIKPDNIYFYNNRFSLGDFGLVSFPDSGDLTKSTRGVGAVFTMAPEMRRYPDKADGKKADVYSLAKTLWILLCEDKKGFEGTYDSLEPKISLRKNLIFKEIRKDRYLAGLEILLKRATEYDPDNRPSMSEFKNELNRFIGIDSDSDYAQADEWNYLNELLFSKNIPTSAKWTSLDSIVDVLNIVGMSSAFNHMFGPDGGGLDFDYAKLANEKNCICLVTQKIFQLVMKPEVLVYERFPDYRWNYFLLKLAPLSPVLGEFESDFSEMLVEDFPSHYVSAKTAQYGVYDYDSGKPLPKGFCVVHRYVGGSFLIALKSGYYNGIAGAYDGRHNVVSPDDFLKYVRRLGFSLDKIFRELRKKIPITKFSDDELKTRILSLDLFNKNPFETEEEEKKVPKEDHLKKEQYILSNASLWHFDDLLPQNQDAKSGAKFYFTFSINSITFGETPTRFYLNKKRILVSYKTLFKGPPLEDCFFVYDRNQSKELERQITKRINQFLNNGGFQPLGVSDYTINIEIRKNINPQRLFTKDELREVILAADDRLDNILVIDENGFAHIVQDDTFLFPVRNSIWCHGNKYAGKYSDLNHLDKVYSYMLCAWLEYLKTGEHQYTSDCVIQTSDDEMINEIKQICGIS
ncbi:protein kinase-like protein [Hallerella porci]|uniref:Protein kinase-like protein n=2 Tax=Hallerella porci TaxID=1945871 RepID=A0ABX5LHS7_9BACT|nr:protein kinase-like protein [Hallerella porci]